ncbi:MAG TPA: hypothetical protein DD643_08140 [Synechococcus sp. UBA8638]|nr:hypothetical protein [Synechococcus sp. UBA8638]
MTDGSNIMFTVVVIAMVLITLSIFSAGGKARLQIRRLRETMDSGIVLSSPAQAGETPTIHGPQDSGYPRHLLQRGLDHLLAALQASDQALTGDTSHWLSYQVQVRWLGRFVGLRQLMDWTQKAPAFLISLGLLGTFIGLSIALEDIGQILRPGLPPAQISSALAEMLNPMGTAFRSSLFGLAFSLLVILNNQIRGWTTAIENLELELSHFFDGQLVKLQQTDPTQGLSPVRKEMAGVVQGLDTFQKKIETTAESFGDRLIHTVDQAVERTMGAHLDELHNQSLMMAEEARHAVERMGEMANRLSEAGQDFIGAATAFRDTDFATTLQDGVQRMVEGQESLARTTASLCERMGLPRESLTHTQLDWQTLAVTAEQELKSVSMASAASRGATSALVEASAQFSQGRDQFMVVQKDLQAASQAICAMSGEAAELAKALTGTLDVDQAIGNSVVATCNILGAAMQSWSASVERTDQLAANYVEGLQAAAGNSLKDLEQQEQELRSSLNRSRDDLVQFVNGEVQQRLASIQQVDRHANQAASMLSRLSAGLQDLHRLVSETTWKNTPEKVTAMEHTTVGDVN